MAVVKRNNNTIFYGKLYIAVNSNGLDIKWTDDVEGPDAFIIEETGISLSNKDTVEKAIKARAEEIAKEQEVDKITETVEL